MHLSVLRGISDPPRVSGRQEPAFTQGNAAAHAPTLAHQTQAARPRPSLGGAGQRRGALSRARQRRGLSEQLAEPLRLEQAATHAAAAERELVEDRLRDGIARLFAPLRAQPGRELAVAIVAVEDAADDELRRDRPVPAVLLQPERDVPAADAAQTVDVRAHAERDRTAAVASVLDAHAEAQMLAVADRREVAQLAARREQHYAGIAEPERRQLPELFGELERQRDATRHDRIDDRDRPELFVGEDRIGMLREGTREP